MIFAFGWFEYEIADFVRSRVAFLNLSVKYLSQIREFRLNWQMDYAIIFRWIIL